MRRDETVAMLRVKNEGRWLRRHLERTWMVARHVVLFDDSSTDNTLAEAKASVPEDTKAECSMWRHSALEVLTGPEHTLHLLRSPFTGLQEVRDKNFLWQYTALACGPKYILALDGDEMLSRQAIRVWDDALNLLDRGARGLCLPFIYLWDVESQRRIDGVYREIWHGRLATTQWTPPMATLSFTDRGMPGGFHCGSIPDLLTGAGRVQAPIIHFGYLEDAIRRRKFQWYSTLDPDNRIEGGYRHIVGEPNHLCPSAPVCQPWTDV